MRGIRSVLLLAIAQVLCIGMAFAQSHGSVAEAKALAEKAVAYVKSAGPDKAFAEFTAKDGKWQDRDLYVFVLKFDGSMLAHGANKALVGKNILDMKDADGKEFVKEFASVAKAKGAGWIDYKWSNPQTKTIQPKSSYVISVPNIDGYVGVGIYK